MQYLIIGGGIVALLAALGVGWIFLNKPRKQSVTTQAPRPVGSLRDEKAISDIILTAIDDGVVLIDETQIVRHFNPAACSITGWQKDEAEGLDWHSLFRFTDAKGETVEELSTPFKKALTSGTVVRENSLNIVGKSNTSIAASFSVSPLLNSSGKVSGLVGVFRDVSQERAEENQRAEFISTASHEMRTPVAAIEGYLSLSLNDKVATIDNRARDYLEKAHSSTQHLGQLFQDLLTSAKAEDGRLANHPHVLEIGAFIEQLASDLKFAAEKKNLFMEFVFGNSEITDTSMHKSTEGNKVIRPFYYVVVDPDRMREVVTNIFDNACKYTDEGKVTLGLTGNDNIVQIYVRDTGAGIPAEDIPHLFQKFYRVDNSATRTIGGTGLGLFICRKIVELYQGRIWVESEMGKGSTFYINLPRISTQQAEGLQTEEASQSIQAVGTTSTLTPGA